MVATPPLLALPLLALLHTSSATDRPIIGVLTQEMQGSTWSKVPGIEEYNQWIVASNVKWVEAGGARVVPVIVDDTGEDQGEYFTQMFSHLNGLMIPGGPDYSTLPTAGYSKAAYAFFSMAMEANDGGDFFPIWGTCLGMEMLGYITAGGSDYLTRCNSQQSLALHLAHGWQDSRLYGQAPQDIVDQLTSLPVTVNRHHWCLTRDSFDKHGLGEFWTILSDNTDSDGLEFISSMEARNYPFYAIQYHPEKNSYTWAPQEVPILHSREATMTALYLSQFLVEEARGSNHSFPSRREEEEALIYNHQPVFTGSEAVGASTTQVYFFP